MRPAVSRAVARWPRPSFGVASLADAASMRLGRRRPASYYRSHVLFTAMRQSEIWPFPSVASGPDPMSFRPPLVLVSFHFGALGTLGALLERLPGEVLSLVGTPPKSRKRSVTTLPVSGGEEQRTIAMMRGITTLRSGGFVFLAVDAQTEVQVQASVFGRPISLARGGFALSRITGAPMLPVTARWRGRKIEIITGDQIPSGDEPTMAAALAEWLERYLTETPGARAWPNVQRLLG